MRVLSTFIAGLVAVLPHLAQGAGGSGPDQRAVRDVVRRYVEAREGRDAKALEALFTPDADQLTSAGEWRRGRDEVVRGSLASSRASGGARTIKVEAVRFPAPGVALADGRYEISGLAGGVARRMWTTLILTRDPEGWRIAGIRNMLPAPPAPAVSRP